MFIIKCDDEFVTDAKVDPCSKRTYMYANWMPDYAHKFESQVAAEQFISDLKRDQAGWYDDKVFTVVDLDRASPFREDETVMVKAWWLDGDLCKCRIHNIHSQRGRDKNFGMFNYTVIPLEGNSHSRWVKESDIIK